MREMLTTLLWKELYRRQPTLPSMLWLKILTYWSSLSITGTTRKMTFSSTLRRSKSQQKWISGGILSVSRKGVIVIGWVIFFSHVLGVVVTQHRLFIAKVSYFIYFLRLCYMSPLKNWIPIYGCTNVAKLLEK